MRDAVIARDGLEVKGTIKVCEFIEHMETALELKGIELGEEGNDLLVEMVASIIKDYSEGGEL